MPETVFRRLDIEAVMERLRSFAERELGGREEVREVILVGSLARGDWTARSDADLVLVVDPTNEPFRDRTPRYLPSEPLGIPVDLLAYTPSERERWSPRFRREVESGVALYQRPDAGSGHSSS